MFVFRSINSKTLLNHYTIVHIMGDADRTLYCGNLDTRKVTEELLYELFLQAGPLESVKMIKDKSFAFICFKHEESVPYTMDLFSGIQLYGRSLRLQFRSGSIHEENRREKETANINRRPIIQDQSHDQLHSRNNSAQSLLGGYVSNNQQQILARQYTGTPEQPGMHRSGSWPRGIHENHQSPQLNHHEPHWSSSERNKDSSSREDFINVRQHEGNSFNMHHRSENPTEFDARRQRLLQQQGTQLDSYGRRQRPTHDDYPPRHSQQSHSRRCNRW